MDYAVVNTGRSKLVNVVPGRDANPE